MLAREYAHKKRVARKQHNEYKVKESTVKYNKAIDHFTGLFSKMK
jgi:hypothetical protein